MKLTCQRCGGEMVKRTISSGNRDGILVALIVIAVGIALIMLVGPFSVGSFLFFGWINGGLLCLVALFLGGKGGKRREVWKCRRCGFIFDSA
jgi:hypothetical protein